MGQAVRKLRPPSRAVTPSKTAAPVVRRQAGDAPAPESQFTQKPENKLSGEWDAHDPNLGLMSRKMGGIITTRPGGKKEHPTATIREKFASPLPTDRHTTLQSGPDEERIQAPGTLNHGHIKELFLLYQGRAEGQERPLDVETLAKRYNLDAGILERLFRHTSLS